MFLSDEDLLHGLFPISLEVSVRLRALAVFGFAGYPLYAHYHLHAPWQIYRSRLQGWRSSGEDIGESLHLHVVQRSNHTTHSGARGRGWTNVGKEDDFSLGHTVLQNKDQRVISGDLYSLFQMVRSMQLSIISTHKLGLEWIDRFEKENQGTKAFEFFFEEEADGEREADGILAPEPLQVFVTPVDVINRLGIPATNALPLQGSLRNSETLAPRAAQPKRQLKQARTDLGRGKIARTSGYGD